MWVSGWVGVGEWVWRFSRGSLHQCAHAHRGKGMAERMRLAHTHSLPYTHAHTHTHPRYIGRDDLETLMASPRAADWVKISEMLLGPVPEGYVFTPKHKANAY